MMDKLLQLWHRLLFYLRRDQFDRELEEEMRFHLEMKAEENLAAGRSPEEARYAAQRQFGNQTLLWEVSRDMWGFRSLETLAQDLRYGARMLLKQPGFTLIAVITLALGIGANTAIFSVVNALLLRPLPYRQPEQLVKVFQAQPDPTKGMLPSVWSYPRFEILRDQNQSFAAVTGVAQNDFNLTGTDAPERLQVEMVSASYFPLLGVDAIAGRTFTAEEP
jgi:MacB-like periplasmic core domain